ncbi:MAG TPA: hypothetical protein VE079_00130 [Ensifer sp.]|nr:hypothetical protein [Ensifer sp.]
MRHKTIFLCGLDQISVPQTLHRGERFADEYYVTTDKLLINSLIIEFADTLGKVETDYLLGRASAVVYRIGEIEVDERGIETSLSKRIIEDMLVLKRLELALWLEKDNAANFDRAWLLAHTKRGAVVHTNSWAARASLADGSYDPVVFSSEELRRARRVKAPLPSYLQSTDAPTLLTKGTMRIQRFQYFIGAARAITDVAMKITQYCSGLEALVSTTQQELSHQVSERVSALLELPGDQRISTFKLVKKAYGYRSKAVHGNSFKEFEVKQLRECSKSLDQVCRRLFGVYFEENSRFRSALEDSDENLTEFFTVVLMGASVDRGSHP